MKVGKQMGRPTEATSKRLFALSGNQCAFPDCRVVLVEQAANSIGEICHIRAHRVKGARFDPSYPPEKLHSFENLLVLCPNHHTKIDDQSDLYTVELLERMKADHESKNGRPERLEDAFPARILLGSRATAAGRHHWRRWQCSALHQAPHSKVQRFRKSESRSS